MTTAEYDTGFKCPKCGYNLTALTASRCPECGTRFTLIDATPPAGGPASSAGAAFVKGGIFTLVGFIALGLGCALIGGRFHIDLCGAVALFAIGGLIGLGLRAIYSRGYREGRSETPHDPAGFDHWGGPPPPPAV